MVLSNQKNSEQVFMEKLRKFEEIIEVKFCRALAEPSCPTWYRVINPFSSVDLSRLHEMLSATILGSISHIGEESRVNYVFYTSPLAIEASEFNNNLPLSQLHYLRQQLPKI
jgi:hypothetical protein